MATRSSRVVATAPVTAVAPTTIDAVTTSAATDAIATHLPLVRTQPMRPGGPTRANVAATELRRWLAQGWRKADQNGGDHGA